MLNFYLEAILPQPLEYCFNEGLGEALVLIGYSSISSKPQTPENKPALRVRFGGLGFRIG